MASSARIDELRKKFDENPRRYFAPLANEYRKAGDFEQAIFICQEYLPQQPGHMSGHIVLGQALFEAKRLPEARTVFETALTLDPENLIALRHLADISRDLGEVTVARGWYERVLQADPRNEEIASIMGSMTGGKSASAPAPTNEPQTGSPQQASTDATVPPSPASAAAPTMELSAAAVQEMIKARQASQPPSSSPKTLDEAPTLELTAPTLPEPMEGLEPTAHSDVGAAHPGGQLDIPSGGLLDAPADVPPKLDIPSGGMLGLEPTAAGSVTAQVPDVSPTEGLDTIPLEVFSVPSEASASAGSSGSKSAAADHGAPPANGLLDLDSFEIGGPASESPDTAVGPTASNQQPASETPIDGGHEGAIDFDFELPAAPSPVTASVPTSPATMESGSTGVLNVITDAVPALVDVVQLAVPAIVDAVQGAVPAVADALTTGPTMIIDVIRGERPKLEGSMPMSPDEAATQQTDIASVVAPASTREASQSDAPTDAPDRSPPAFVTETMAQLYLEQGHRDQALDIYRQLVAAKPNDVALRDKLDALEHPPARARGADVVAPQDTALSSPERSMPSAAKLTIRKFNESGPRIREVLRDLLGIDGSGSNGNATESTVGNGELGSIDVLFSAAAGNADLDQLATAFDGGYVAPAGSIDAVFASAQ